MALLVFLAAFSAALSAQIWKGTIVKDGDVTIVRNPKTPIYKDPILMLKEELTIGGGETKEPAMLGEISSIVVDSIGRIYVLDGTSLQVKVFDKSGGYVRSTGRKGEGPGEFMDPYRMMIDRRNNRLFVKDVKFGFVIFDSQGKHIKNLSADDARRSQNSAIDSRGSIILDSIKIQDMEHRWDVLKRFDAEMMAGTDIRSVDIGSPYNVAAPLVDWALASNDDIVFGYPETYRVEWM
ncbi:MAG: 6-bladed beta-propeller, partial [Candidatus Aminicenantes bacterium]|nr:6-bladed beta-propeller [Candidatus Aminicenantes bacterium]